jgi:co-chaperonin GroES (HSP10)|tara:strand:+ start:452 stop:796 length:345 start_codon:yes stop_codon:yes gene_type:complete
MTTTIEAAGHYLLVAPRMPKTKTAGGIILADISIDAEKMNVSVAQVIDVGPLAYRDRQTGQYWKSGPWCKQGDWVICPRFGTKQLSEGDQNYSLMNDDEVMAVVANPSDIKAYI